MVVFDVLEVDGEDVRQKPLSLRRAILEELLTPCPDGLQLSKKLVGNGHIIFKHDCSTSLEGIVSKRADKPYGRGQCAHWLKVKNADSRRQ